MDTYKLITVFTSTYPIDCHILKGRLETEGITCFIYDENLIWVHPFKSVALGGVKLKVIANDYKKAQSIIENIESNILLDEDGEYKIDDVLNNEYLRQEAILNFKEKVQGNPVLLDQIAEVNHILKEEFFTVEEKKEIIESEKEFYTKSKKKNNFSWKQFWYELFDYEQSLFIYLYPNTSEFGIEKDLLDKYSDKISDKESTHICPKCNSDNVKFGYAIDYKPDILYLVLTLIARSPFFPFRKKYHCFNCGNNFK